MKHYVLTIAVATLLLGAIVVAFNYRVDPYAIYHFDTADEESMNRIDQFWHYRITKPWHVMETRPTSIVLGTSRTAASRPDLIWPGEAAYNLSVPGMTIYELLRFIEFAQANGPLDHLIIGLDFEAFVRPEPRTRHGFSEERMARTPEELDSLEFKLQLGRDVFDTLVSLPAFVRSLTAIEGTINSGRRYYRDGTWQITSDKLTGTHGYIFTGKTTVYAIRNEPLGLDANFEVFAEILRFAHEQNIETRLFVTPEHVYLVDYWWRLGYGEMWGDFHTRLTQVNLEVARELGRKPFPLFAFNDVEGVVDEPIKKPELAEDSLFTDGVHTRKPLGDRIIRAVWSQEETFGTKLDSRSVGDYLARVDRLRLDFEAANQETTAMLRGEASKGVD